MRFGPHMTNTEIVSDESWRLVKIWQPTCFLWTYWTWLEDVERGMREHPQATHIVRLPNRQFGMVAQYYNIGIRYFQMGNEPSHEFIEVVDGEKTPKSPKLWNDTIRFWLDGGAKQFSDAVWLYSPMPVGPQYDDINRQYWEDARDIIGRPNVQIAVHAYWQKDNYDDYTWGLHFDRAVKLYPDKEIWVTEVGSTDRELPKITKASQYTEWRDIVRLEYPQVKGACVWGMGMSDDWEKDNINITQEMVEIMKEDHPEPEPEAIGERVVARARSWKGKLTYCLGGKDSSVKDKKCGDCSWLVYDAVTNATGEMFASAGGTWWQLQACRGFGREARLEDLKTPGIVFWSASPQDVTPGHVGIATGQGTVIELTERYNGVVETTIQEWLPHVHSCWRMPWGASKPTPEPQCENCKRLEAELEQEKDRLVRIQNILLEDDSERIQATIIGERKRPDLIIGEG